MITDDLLECADALYDIGQPLWSAHTERVESVKTGRDAIINYFDMSNGKWQAVVQHICHATFRDIEKLARAGLLSSDIAPQRQEVNACRRVELALALIGQFDWSMLLAYGSPPIKYASILHQSDAMRSVCAEKMRRDWDAILRLEADSVTEASAKEVAENAQLMVPEAARLAFMLFERGHFDPCFAPFQSYMRALLDVLPDSRIVEQTHQHLRKMENENANNVSSRLARQNACVFSGVLQERGLPAVTLQEEEFCCRMRAQGVGVP